MMVILMIFFAFQLQEKTMEANDTMEALKHVYRSQLPETNHLPEKSKTEAKVNKSQDKQEISKSESIKTSESSKEKHKCLSNPSLKIIKSETMDRFSDEMSV